MIERLGGLLFVASSVVIEALGHIAFKRAADFGRYSPTAMSVLEAALKRYKWISSGVGCFVAQGICWTLALKTLDISLAYPISSMELIVIMILCRLVLKERVGFRRWIGVTLIIGGSILVGLS
jgi:undecaprenyl phosphate-alpha-L-ara4N flippase subunit ArnE